MIGIVATEESMTYREKATQIASAEARAGVKEVGTNTGPKVQVYQRADGLKLNPDTSYPWCAAFVCWAFEKAGRPLEELKESASVGFLLNYANQHGWGVTKPARGDCVCFYWGSDNWPDHIGLVTEISGGKVLTVEGNTGPDGRVGVDGVYFKTRDTERMAFFRVPGEVDSRDLADEIVDPVVTITDDQYKKWAAWRVRKPKQTRAERKREGAREKWRSNRPKDIPREVPHEWWERLVDELK
jgi:hypothetical protein